MNTAELPLEIRAKLAELELELSEGDITEKGYQKKRAKLLEPYEKNASQNQTSRQAQSPTTAPSAAPRRALGQGTASPNAAGASGGAGGGGGGRRRNGRRYTRDDMRYRSAGNRVKVSKVREEAVKEALSRLKEQGGGPEPVFMMNKRRAGASSAAGGHHGHHGAGGGASSGHGHHGHGAGGRGEAVGASGSRETRNQMFSDTDDDDDDDDDDDSSATLEGHSSSSSRRSTVPGPSGGSHMVTTPPAAHRPVPSARSIHLHRGDSSAGSGSGPSAGGAASSPASSAPGSSAPTGGSGGSGQQGAQTPTGAGQHVIVGNNYKGMPSNTSRLDASGGSRPKGSQPPPDLTSSTSTLRRADILIGENGSQSGSREGSAARETAPAGTPGSDGGGTATAAAQGGSVRVTPDAGPFRTRVSAKIEQLVNTLKRPKRRPLNEYFVDEEEGVIATPRLDPDAPRPQGAQIEPAVGDPLAVPSGLPRNLESALDHGNGKSPAITVLDKNAKPSYSITYMKLKSRGHKVAYNLLNKLGPRGELSLKPRDRVALAFPNNDPISFACAFFGCLLADVVPVPIEVPPNARRDSTCQSMGFLLSSLDVRVVLTSEDCYKCLPKTNQGSSGPPEVVALSSWPRVHWSVIDSMSAKPPKDWRPPQRLNDDDTAYIEYTFGRDGSVRGVTYSRAAVVEHCRTLTVVCGYMESDVVVCVLDYKREAGLWHGLLASVFNACHVIFIPYALMKEDPASWLRMVTRYKAGIALAKSRDMHWALLAQSEHKEVNLSSLRMLLVADGANPWSLTSCDSFLNVFQARGLRPEALCPCAASSETLTLAVRRPGRQGNSNVGRGVLSMHGLSYGVVRVEAENCLRSLTLQDCGQVAPGAEAVVVRPGTAPYLCKQDEVGELCLRAAYTGSGYWGLQGQTNAYFRVTPLGADGRPACQGEFVRTGLLGFLGPASSGGLIFVCGSMEGLMTVSGRRHNTDDIIATILAVEPMKFVYRGRIAVFSQTILKDERIIIVAEQRPDCSEQASIQWMSRVLQAIDSIHQVGVYCLALVPPNHLPKTPLGGVHVFVTQQRFANGTLHPSNVLMCPHTCVTNIPQLRESQHHGGGGSMGHGGATPSVGPSAMMVGSLVQGARLASAQGREMSLEDEDEGSRRFQFLSEILQWRASATPDHRLYTVVNAKVQDASSISCVQLHKKAEKIGSMLLEKAKLSPGAHVALLYPPGIELVCAVYGCLYAGCVPVPIRPPHPHNLSTTLPTCKMTIECAHAAAILTCTPIVKVLKSKEASAVVEFKTWPTVLDSEDSYRKRMTKIYRSLSAEQELCYLDFSVSTTGTLSGIRLSHASAAALCRSQKLQCELYPAREVALCLDPYSGLGFALWCLSGVYCGHHSVLVPPMELEVNPAVWLTVCANRQVRDTFCSYGVMELCTRELGLSTPALKAKGVSLSSLRSLVVVAEERPRLQLTTSFSKLFASLGLSPRAVSTSFGCRVNVAICLQGASSPDITTVYVDTWSLRNDRVKMLEKGSPHSLCLMESGKLLPGVKVVIANPDTFGQCADSHLGEIWVSSPHNADGYYSVFGSDTDLARQQAQHFNARLATGEVEVEFARTGYLGFVRRTELTQSDGERHDALFVVGSLDEAIFLRGQCFHPIDLEATVLRCHRRIVESAVFVWANLLVVVVELDGPEHEALDLVPLVTTAILEEHYLIVGVVVVVDPGSVLINSRGEKQRVHLRDSFLGDKLDPIYVAYNM